MRANVCVTPSSSSTIRIFEPMGSAITWEPRYCNRRVLNGIREAPTLFDALPSERERIPDKVRRAVYERDGWACVQCGSRERLTVDHKWPHIRGGTPSLANLQTLCTKCNSAKNDAAGQVA